jgi:hypothetical protein
VNEHLAKAFVLRLDGIARDAGWLRRRFRSNPDAWTGEYIAERLAGGIESLAGLVWPTAGELQRDYFTVCGDHDLAVEEALEVVDRRAAQLQRLLGRDAA